MKLLRRVVTLDLWVSLVYIIIVHCTGYLVRACLLELKLTYNLQFRMSTVRKQTPNEFLKQLIGRPVVVKLSSGVDYRGIFANLDGYV